jgi:hypothetical protein
VLLVGEPAATTSSCGLALRLGMRREHSEGRVRGTHRQQQNTKATVGVHIQGAIALCQHRLCCCGDSECPSAGKKKGKHFGAQLAAGCPTVAQVQGQAQPT